MCYAEDDAYERAETEELHCDAMLFKVQCLWRYYEELVAGPHSEKRAKMLLDEIDVLEANLNALGKLTPSRT